MFQALPVIFASLLGGTSEVTLETSGLSQSRIDGAHWLVTSAGRNIDLGAGDTLADFAPITKLNDATLIIREMIMEKRKDAFEMDLARMKFIRDSKNRDEARDRLAAYKFSTATAEKLGLTAVTIDAVDRSGRDPAGKLVDLRDEDAEAVRVAVAGQAEVELGDGVEVALVLGAAVVADVAGSLALDAVDEHGELDPLRPPVVEERLDRRPDRAAGIEDVVHEHHGLHDP